MHEIVVGWNNLDMIYNLHVIQCFNDSKINIEHTGSSN